ncbi:von Willebrand factor type A domain-containing protein [Agriterribacter sp.]|uniref:vWA domain-containing protein n=1 Tax=Agriterribacter sp. TaxID=2821509 RepID=UPI002C974116|nr:von Willebrand factor type A domain-containing protein [Agriterribacter sp.]HRP54629.1 von Willebrand factor type A domain-containing protein [Agriterribacter sp.]
MKQVTIICGMIIIAALTAFLPKTSFTVKGTVTDSTGAVLPAVAVTEKGTANITQTDANGNFIITVSDTNAVLIFSSLGFGDKEVEVSGKSMLYVQLSPTADSLEEVVITGYGPVSKKNFTGSAVREAETNRMLQGSVAGVAVQADASYPSPAARKAGNRYYRLYQPGDEDFNTEDYDGITENRFLTVKENPLSTFSIDVDAASYSNVRRFLNNGQLPPAGAVRIEEMINYFHYDYPQPANGRPFSIYTELSEAPWNKDHRLVLVSLQGKKVSTENIPASNLVFLIDVSGSMEAVNKLPLVKQSMKLLTDQLREKDKVAIVVYAGSAGLVLPATSGANTQTIKDAIERLTAGGSTAGGAGIKLAYNIARQNFVQGGNNRVILCTDGDFNVGASSDDDMERLIEQERKSGVFLTVLGYGMGNYKDNKMQKLADKGNGNHAYIDDMNEAKKVLVSEFGGTLFTIAKDVKLQVEFNPAKVQAYRLIGYENRMLNKEDFNNDKKDAGELGSGHTVTALYEVIPVGVQSDFVEKVDPLKYQGEAKQRTVNSSPELLTIKFRYKDPAGEKSKLTEHPVTDGHIALNNTSGNFRFAAAVAQFGMLLTHSEFMQQSSYNNVLALANSAVGDDAEGYRKGFLELVKKAGSLAKLEKRSTGEDELAGRK